MAKIIYYLRLKNMTILQSFITLNCVYLVAVLTATVIEFEWADRMRRRFADHPSGNDWVLSFQIIAMLLTIGVGLVLMASLFYKLKLKKPLEILMSASEKISANDLGFKVSYDSRDEMSDLCRAFEKMRSQLERYVEAMSSIQKLDEIPIHKKEIEINTLIALLDEGASRIAELRGTTYDSYRNTDSTILYVDLDLVMQVFENIIANGVRYAFSQVKVDYLTQNGFFSITVTDDGPGFTNEGVQKAVLPFYRGEAPEANEHHGLGLYTCKTLCEKHQGGLEIANSSTGGGKITVSFLCRVDK